MNRLANLLLAVIFGALPAGMAAASDAAKEQRWSEQIVDSLLVGEAVTLEAGGQKFLAIHAEQTGAEARGGVILLHGIGAHPDWPEVIAPLRQSLPDHGWTTLSLQMPIAENDAPMEDYVPLFDEAPARIQAGIEYLRGKGVENIVLVGHSLGAAMGSAFLAATPTAGVRAFVGIGMGRSKIDARMDNAVALEKISIPVLDLYGSRDLPAVLESAKHRAAAARKAGNAGYAQVEITGADHFFRGLDEELVIRVRGWIQKSTAR